MKFVTGQLLCLILILPTSLVGNQKRSLEEDLVPGTRTLKPIEKKAQLKDLTLTPKIGSSPHQLAPINPAINLELLKDPSSYPPGKAVQPVKPAINWLPIKRNPAVPLVGMVQRDGLLFLSIYGHDQRLPAELEQKIRSQIKEPQKGVQITGDLLRTILTHSGITEVIHFRSFRNPKVHSIPVSQVNRLIANFLMDGDRPLTEILIPTEVKSTEKDFFDGVGLAWIGSQNLLTDFDASQVKWEKSPPLLATSNLLSWYRYVYPNSHVPNLPPTTFRKSQVEALEIHELQSRGNNSGPPEEMLGYAVKTKKGIFLLREPYATVVYGQRPSSIWMGKLLDGYESLLYVSSTTMGDCGSFILIETDGDPIEVPVRCASYGC